MHDIEPYYRWRDEYIASEDRISPMYNYVNSDDLYTHQIYNYCIHPQWDYFGSDTLFLKILYVDYELGFCFIEFIGEWNDAITNDVMFLRRNVIAKMIDNGIFRFILLTENVLNFHGSDDCYYEEWLEEIIEENGWICLLNTQEHVLNEMQEFGLQHYMILGTPFDDVVWRSKKPNWIYKLLESIINKKVHQLKT